MENLNESTPQEEVQAPELPEEILNIIRSKNEESGTSASSIQQDLSDSWMSILSSGLIAEARKEIMEKYPSPPIAQG